ncbi:hypothetical protein AQUCO_05900042v1 [Aquilegia coerulea]|uniref:MULE transposase domain-containing protein n=1 Tax=Aquilegia coerulea TaxID=218851 RepID=A0A2G5CE41_AQUCA|nr:hypothetical protein AQUCO_05900042v1 [Aquilegia coerulea]
MENLQETNENDSKENFGAQVEGINVNEDSLLSEQTQVVTSQKASDAYIENSVQYPDLSMTFTTDRIFVTRSDLIQWAQKMGLICGTVVVVSKSEMAPSDRRPRLYLRCEWSGKYRDRRKKTEITNEEELDNEGKIKKKLRRMGTKKFDCPFMLRGVFVPGSEDQWKVEVQCARHNHGLATSFEGHTYVGRLTPEQERLVFDMIKAGVGPKHSLNVIKDRDPNNSSTIRHMYNAKQKHKKLEKADMTELQQLKDLLNENGYVEVSRCEEGLVVVKNLFWAHPKSVKLAKCFPQIFIMDPTYKTNKYRWPLLEIVGVTSTMKTFSVCFALMERETEDDFTWALEFFEDRALMNAANVIFPTAVKFLCRWHISKDVLKETQDKDMEETLCDKWAKVVLSTTEVEYVRQLRELEDEFNRWPTFLHYLHQTWLGFKERFVAAWTDQHMHFGNTSTNRVEGAHASLKRALRSSKYDFLGMWHMIHPSLTVQKIEITASFERNLNCVKHEHNIQCFENIRGIVSINALDLIVKERNRCNYVGIDNNICGCNLRRTHGLPCAHELNIIGLQSDKIHSDEINEFWKKLSITAANVDLSDLEVRPEFLAFVNRYKNSTNDQRRFMLKKMLELGNPRTCGLLQPLVKTKPKGRPLGSRNKMSNDDNSTKRDPLAFELEIPKLHSSQSAQLIPPTKKLKVSQPTPVTKKLQVTKSKKLNVMKTLQTMGNVSIMKFPEFFWPFIVDSKNVDGDGNCGFRAVAACLEMDNENGWIIVRTDLRGELIFFRDEYSRMFGGEEQVNALLDILDSFDSPCPAKNWFLLPYMGYLVASRYHCLLVSISLETCLTFVPLRTAPSGKQSQVIAIGHIDGNHFVPLKLKVGCPIPEPVLFWKKFHNREAGKWENFLKHRNRAFNEIAGNKYSCSQKYVIYVVFSSCKWKECLIHD